MKSARYCLPLVAKFNTRASFKIRKLTNNIKMKPGDTVQVKTASINIPGLSRPAAVKTHGESITGFVVSQIMRSRMVDFGSAIGKLKVASSLLTVVVSKVPELPVTTTFGNDGYDYDDLAQKDGPGESSDDNSIVGDTVARKDAQPDLGLVRSMYLIPK